jgi:hypothetical protein
VKENFLSILSVNPYQGDFRYLDRVWDMKTSLALYSKDGIRLDKYVVKKWKSTGLLPQKVSQSIAEGIKDCVESFEQTGWGETWGDNGNVLSPYVRAEKNVEIAQDPLQP